jgi:hypothetical protein
LSCGQPVFECFAAVDEQHRNLLPVLLLQISGAIDIDLLEVERSSLGYLPNHGFHLVAQATLDARVQDQPVLHLGVALLSSRFGLSPKPMAFFGIPRTPQNHSDKVPSGAGVIVGSSIGPLILKLATKNEFFMAAIPRPSSGM